MFTDASRASSPGLRWTTWQARLSPHRWSLALAGFVVITILTRLPFQSRVPFNWDSVNYLLALQHFDTRIHQPHPPGNPLYVLTGKAFALISGEPNQALVWTSIFFAVVAVLGTAVLGRQLGDEAAGVWAALLLLVNPLFWLYSEVALSYTAEAVAGLVVGLAVWRCRTHPGRHSAALLGLALALAGGLRPTVLILLGPLALFGLFPLTWRQRALALTVGGLLSLAWAVPLVALSGGPSQYWRSLQALTTNQVSESSLLNGVSTYWLLNLLHLASALIIGLLPVAIVATYPFLRRRRLPALRRDMWLFLILWIAPPLIFFFAVHFGQWGYLLLVLPASSVLATVLLLQASSTGQTAWQGHVSFLLLLASQISAALVFQRMTIVEHDRAWQETVRLVRTLPPTGTVILTPAQYASEFRLAGYLLPEYRVIGVGHGLDGRWGAVIMSQHWQIAAIGEQRQPPEMVQALRLTETEVVYCPTAETLVILGKDLQRRIADPLAWGMVALPADRALYLYPVSRPICVDFSDGRVNIIEPRGGLQHEARLRGHIETLPRLWVGDYQKPRRYDTEVALSY
ncbi:DUF2723 domain-containing protein [Thermomicrobiaceae bacterium CFH 74404]|uniref:DUF2723 domain-containing protein n=1 Tax=Thermalbibacter longus TaxID=2951981 RepID=A0AA42BCB0_9BACT|nr:DUF2723 domain-containing protein [Thermalbibacter longus]MCM8750689.1 DUF2723 domain-containing protein [Thermalbibacter longus]